MTPCACALAAPDVERALAALVAAAPVLEGVDAPLAEALGRVLARTIHAPRAYPPFNRAMMDGYAARHADLEPFDPETTLRVRAESGSDRSAPAPLPAGHCAPIATGAPLPPGADVVLRRERVFVSDGRLRPLEPLGPWTDCETIGTIAMPGATLLSAGTTLGPGELSIAARHGLATLPVYRAPRVAVLVTGDELIPPGAPCPTGSIHDSNSILIEAILTRLGADHLATGAPLPDHRPTLEREVHRQLARADLVCLVGGSSVGRRDFSREILARLGTPLFEGVAMRPGRPTSATVTPEGKLVLALPGRPAALFTALHVLVRPVLAFMQGRTAPAPMPRARLATPIDPGDPGYPGVPGEPGEVDHYLPVRLECRNDGGWDAIPGPAAEHADALAVIRTPSRTLNIPANTPANTPAAT
ncbi:MAG: molybdopterin molybdotransferase MoeA, partial [Halothiobacillaceae bacterium]|nr:molybdopterin molybdotransferase MoeA [Halothiobacillaceae bacterium]